MTLTIISLASGSYQVAAARWATGPHFVPCFHRATESAAIHVGAVKLGLDRECPRFDHHDSVDTGHWT
jgi:hypothetical protein